MNYWLPLDGHMTMHCSANVGKDGDSALFFGEHMCPLESKRAFSLAASLIHSLSVGTTPGLSGTGKTTLSADPARNLIGDDEHGWDEDGIFNFEGGCYAKTIDLTEENEPDIYRAIKTDALLENVHVNDDDTPDYHNTAKTENGRVGGCWARACVCVCVCVCVL